MPDMGSCLPELDRRGFLRISAAAGVSLATGCRQAEPHPDSQSAAGTGGSLSETAHDEAYWRQVRNAFDLEADLINLNHGLSPAPRDVQAALLAELEQVNRAPLLHMRGGYAEGRREQARNDAARMLGCDPEEVAITRSGTESLQVAQLGIDLQSGDQVLSTREDYWSAWNTWQQRVKREGIEYREIDLGGPYPPPEDIVARFEQALTPRTRVILFSQVTWRTGHILPVTQICELARSRGILTIVDGAQGFGHIPFRLAELGCDYYATSGHKWLHAPLGTGLLYVRRDRIRDLWPPAPAPEGLRTNIRKFEPVGSRSPAHHNAITGAVQFLEQVEPERKARRLHYLKLRWAERLARHERVHVVTDLRAASSCGIASFYVDEIDSSALAEHLLRSHRVLVGPPIDGEWSGPPLVRIVPNAFTSSAEIDVFCEAVEAVLRNGITVALDQAGARGRKASEPGASIRTAGR